MTCIVGLVENDNVWIGGDSAASDRNSLIIVNRADKKVFQNGEFLFGCCNSFRVMQLFQYSFDPPEHSIRKDDMSYMVNDFVDALRNICREKGALIKENEVERMESDILVGYRGKLYVIESDFQVGEQLNSYASVGSGDFLALGALYATQKLGLQPEKRIELALSAAAEFNMGVRAPFIIMSTNGAGI